jgi:hypothetical protein
MASRSGTGAAAHRDAEFDPTDHHGGERDVHRADANCRARTAHGVTLREAGRKAE